RRVEQNQFQQELAIFGLKQFPDRRADRNQNGNAIDHQFEPMPLKNAQASLSNLQSPRSQTGESKQLIGDEECVFQIGRARAVALVVRFKGPQVITSKRKLQS